VPLAEEGWSRHKVAGGRGPGVPLLPLKRKGIDTLVLGCTHYPLLKSVIRKVMGSKVVLVDSANETAREVKEMLESMHLQSGRLQVAFSAHEPSTSPTFPANSATWAGDSSAGSSPRSPK